MQGIGEGLWGMEHLPRSEAQTISRDPLLALDSAGSSTIRDPIGLGLLGGLIIITLPIGRQTSDVGGLLGALT
jgi:hypothetical protein